MDDKDTLIAALRKAAFNLETTKNELAALKEKENEAVAIIGIGCRFPGGANNPELFWSLLTKGFSAAQEVPKSRWNIDDYYNSDPNASGKMYVRRAGFLSDPIDQFDPQLFGISTREAEFMDPQQRLILEVVWEALEDAGINPRGLKGSATGVYVGVTTQDFLNILNRNERADEITSYQITGNSSCLLAGRISYIFGLQGPCFPIDTACSASLVSLDSAVQSLKRGDCNLAITGGVNIILSPETIVGMCQARMLSPDGICKTFDAEADGYGRGEGCGIAILKRLSDAKKDGDRILAIIRGTGVNQDGASSGLTVPNGEAQSALLRSVWAKAKIKGSQIDYIETHGTGTSLGDPIEVNAIKTALGEESRENPLWIASVKTNIGHLESAASIASLIKVILSLQHEAIPPHINFKNLNPHIDLNSIPAKIPLEIIPWKRSAKSRLAAISSFSLGGTNAHVVIEEAPVEEKINQPAQPPFYILAVSAKTELALEELYKRYGDFLEKSNPELNDFCYTCNAGRAPLEFRSLILSTSKEEMINSLRKKPSFQKISPKKQEVAFFFLKNESLTFPIDKELYSTSPVFKQTVDRCIEVIDKEFNCSLFVHLFESHNENSQLLDSLALFTVDYALACLWINWGIKPSYVVGEGIGEYLAAVTAEVMTLEESVKLLAKNLKNHAAPSINYRLPSIPFLSIANYKIIESTELNERYFIEALVRKLDVPKAIKFLQGLGCLFFLEIGTKTTFDKFDKHWLSSLDSTKDHWKTLLEALSHLYLNGFLIDWANFQHPFHPKKISIPTYPFQRRRYWPAAIFHNNTYRRSNEKHPLLDELVNVSLFKGHIFQSRINLNWLEFIAEHKINQLPFISTELFLSTLLSAANFILPKNIIELENIEFFNPLFLEKDTSYIVQTIVHPEINGQHLIEISSFSNNPKSNWIQHAKACLLKSEATSINSFAELFDLQARLKNEFSGEEVYQYLQNEFHFHPGSKFKLLDSVYRENEESLAKINWHTVQEDASRYILHPGIIDGFSQIINIEGLNKNESIPWTFPKRIKKISINPHIENPAWIYANIKKEYETKLTSANLQLYNAKGEIMGEIQNLEGEISPEDSKNLKKSFNPSIPDWFYEIIWELQPLPAIEPNSHKGNWLIFIPSENDLLIKKMERLRYTCIQVLPGGHFKKKSTSHYQISPYHSEDMEALLKEINKDLSKELDKEITGILFLWTLELDKQPLKISSIQESQQLGCFSITRLIRNIIHLKIPFPFLVICTNSIQSINQPTITVSHSVLNGYIKTIRLEFPQMVVKHVDLNGPLKTEAQINNLLDELSIRNEPQVAYREDQRYVSRLEPLKDSISLKADPSITLDPNGSYLITGGLGGLGLKFAGWLVSKGAKHIVLVGRQARPESEDIINYFRSRNVIVKSEKLDVGNPVETERLINKFGNEWPPLRGIIHASAIFSHGTFMNHPIELFEEVFASKVNGSWNLHQATLNKPLDFFILCSSIASVLGFSSHLAYSSANSFLDGLAYYRRQHNLPAISISWGGWDDVGEGAKWKEHNKQTGVNYFSPKDALSALEIALQLNKTHVLIADVDWKMLTNKILLTTPFFSKLVSTPKPLEESAQSLDNIIHLFGAEPSKRKDKILKYVRSQVFNVLSLPETQDFDNDQDFFQGGMDSLMAAILRNNVQKDFNPLQLSTTLVFENPTINQLVDRLEETITSQGKEK